MKPLLLDEFSSIYPVIFHNDGIELTAVSDWIVSNETRLSYTTIVRLIEFCREYHWNKDIVKHSKVTNLDCITKSIECNFFLPIIVGTRFFIQYEVVEARHKGYQTRFLIKNLTDQFLFTEFTLISLFYDLQENKVVEPPAYILSRLYSLYKGLLP